MCLTGAGHRSHPGALGELSRFRHASPCTSGVSKLVPQVPPPRLSPEPHPHRPSRQGLPFNGFPFHGPDRRAVGGTFTPLWKMHDDRHSPRKRSSWKNTNGGPGSAPRDPGPRVAPPGGARLGHLVKVWRRRPGSEAKPARDRTCRGTPDGEGPPRCAVRRRPTVRVRRKA